MQGRALYWITTVLAATSIALVVVDGVMVLRNQAAQVEIAQRNLYINQSAQIARAYETLVRALASVAASGKDDQVRDLLGQYGFTLTNPVPASGPAAPGSANPVTVPVPAAPAATKE
ncbi:MAG: hypothetical protein JO010_01710 [Alphaproteobacteria bacterium]|nr:hypothetical protein [Alphaproteobacteria bacterium]